MSRLSRPAMCTALSWAARGCCRRLPAAAAACVLVVFGNTAAAAITVTDGWGRTVRLAEPAQRIIAVAPSLVENAYAAGIGDKLVGAGAYSNYPPQARKLPRVGSAKNINMEAIIALSPDLVVVWSSGQGASRTTLNRLHRLRIPVYVASPDKLTDIANVIVDLGTLGGRPAHARRVAARFRARLAALRARYADRETVSVFYQVWNKPLLTLSGDQFVGAVIRLCGGRNVFAGLDAVAPRVSLEAVLARNPEAIVASGSRAGPPKWLNDWKQWPGLQAVKQDNLYAIPSDLIQRPTLRILEGAQRLCHKLQEARADD